MHYSFFLLMTVTLPYCLYLRIFVFAILECPDSVLGDWTSTSTSHFFLSSKMRAVLVIITGKLFRSHAKNTSKLLWKELTRPICFIKAGKWTEMQFIYSYHPTWRKKTPLKNNIFQKTKQLIPTDSFWLEFHLNWSSSMPPIVIRLPTM